MPPLNQDPSSQTNDIENPPIVLGTPEPGSPHQHSSPRVDSFYAHMHIAWREVYRGVIQELGTKDYKKIFDRSIKMARAAAESAKESRRCIRTQLQDIRTAVEDERGNVARKNERIAILTAQLQPQAPLELDTRKAAEKRRAAIRSEIEE
ncbi:MAG: hypothetical protein LQ339_004136 [Xanthoria mediterranea]|nr:MAG: hypothetical protein LQ339_004136 [Xanthoria mediterranea]